MAAEQNMVQAITQATTEAAKATIMAVREAINPVNTSSSVKVMYGIGSPAL